MTYQIGVSPYKNGDANIPLEPLFHTFFRNFSTENELNASLSFYSISWNQSSRLITAQIIMIQLLHIDNVRGIQLCLVIAH